MSDSIIVRTAKKDYVCLKCGNLIKSGTDYLDRVIFNGKDRIEHKRYHDECPKEELVQRLFSRLYSSNGEVFAIDANGTKWVFRGLRFADCWNVELSEWKSVASVHLVPVVYFMSNFLDENGNQF